MIKKLKNRFSGGVKIASDMVFTMGATIVMQLALQIILYPLLNKYFGESTTGTILYFMGIVYIFPQAVGTALCNTRLISRKTMDATNGDFSKILIISCVVSGAICFYIGYKDEKDWLFALLFALFTVVYAVRMYALVEFRLKEDFKGYFIYHVIISAGYLAGLGLYFLTHYWLIIFFTGELLGIVYSLVKGSIFKHETPIGDLKKNIKNYLLITISILLRDGVNQYDKVVIFTLISSDLVAQYNAVSLIGKSMQMLINPVNTLIVTYLSVKGAGFTKEKFKKFSLMCIAAGVAFLVFCQIATPIYIKLFYSSFYDEIIHYSFIVNCGLILGFVASLFNAIIMSQGKTTVYTAIQAVWGGLYIVLAYIFTKQYSIAGLAGVAIVLNGLKLIAGMVIARITCVKDEAELLEELEAPNAEASLEDEAADTTAPLEEKTTDADEQSGETDTTQQTQVVEKDE